MSAGSRDYQDNADREVAAGNPWYTTDQFESQVYGAYRHNMQHRYAYVRAQLKRRFIQPRLVLDVGCGDGQWSAFFAGVYDCRMIGVDYNKLRLERYKQHVPRGETRTGSCLQLPIADASVDFVMAHQVLEHISNVEAAVAELRRVVTDDGWLLASVPNEGTWLKQRVQYRWIEPTALRRSDHVQFFTANSFRNLLINGGFDVCEVASVGFYFPHNGVSRRLIRHKWIYEAGVALARIAPVLNDCLFAWARPQDA